MLKTRLLLLPLIVKTFAPGPVIVRFLSISNSPVVSVMVPTTLGAKVIVLPGQALLMMARKEPAPVSLLLVTSVAPQLTVIVAVAGLPPKPAFELLNEACTWKLKVVAGLDRLFAGVNFNPALPSAIVMN